MAALGIHAGGWVHVAAAVAGLSALLALVPQLHLALRLAGAAYLLWIGLRLMRGGASGPLPSAARSGRQAFLESATVQVLNPKVALFFVAFLPQFTDPAAPWPVPVQLLVLGVLVNLIFLGFDMAVALLAGALRSAALARPGVARWLHRVAGAVLVGLGVRLALARG
jgi:threonine/homoserine/homoserine lactone efflux protein